MPGITTRARLCSPPVFGGNDCRGKSTEIKSCSALGIINILSKNLKGQLGSPLSADKVYVSDIIRNTIDKRKWLSINQSIEMHFTIWIEYCQKGSNIRNQMQRDFLTMYNRLEIAVLWFLLFLLIHICAPADCGQGHMKLPVGQIKWWIETSCQSKNVYVYISK